MNAYLHANPLTVANAAVLSSKPKLRPDCLTVPPAPFRIFTICKEMRQSGSGVEATVKGEARKQWRGERGTNDAPRRPCLNTEGLLGAAFQAEVPLTGGGSGCRACTPRDGPKDPPVVVLASWVQRIWPEPEWETTTRRWWDVLYKTSHTGRGKSWAKDKLGEEKLVWGKVGHF